MKEIMQNLSANRVANHRKSNILRMLTMLTLLVAVSLVLGLSSPVPTTSALVNDVAGNSTALEDECTLLPPDGESTCNDESSQRSCTSNFRYPTEMTVENFCTGETVLVQGELHVVIHTTMNRNGTHMRMHMEFHGMGTTVGSDTASTRAVKYILASESATQTDYTVSLVRNSGFNISGPPPENFSDPISMQVISHGGSPNFTLHSEIHVTVNANGDATACMTHSHASCEVPNPDAGR